MAFELVPQFINTVGEIMEVIAPNAGGTVPDENSEEWNQWLLAIQMKYEEASRRGFWRRLLTKEELSLNEGDTEILLPDRFQRANSLYILAINNVDLADPHREPDDQSAVPQLINDPDDTDFGKWKIILERELTASDLVETPFIWYWAAPPKPTATDDELLLPGDMIAFGAMIEIFRAKNLPGSQDDARVEYENRLSTYLAMEMIPPRNELLTFRTNPKHIDRLAVARRQYMHGRNRLNRTF